MPNIRTVKLVGGSTFTHLIEYDDDAGAADGRRW